MSLPADDARPGNVDALELFHDVSPLVGAPCELRLRCGGRLERRRRFDSSGLPSPKRPQSD